MREIMISGATEISLPSAARALKFHRGGTRSRSLRGYVLTTYAQLREAFGEPDTENQVSANWDLVFEDGTEAAVYVYKTYPIPTSLHSWHVGSHSNAGVARVAEVLGINHYLLELSEHHSQGELPF